VLRHVTSDFAESDLAGDDAKTDFHVAFAEHLEAADDVMHGLLYKYTLSFRLTVLGAVVV
jgi:hypothetical protein